MDRIKHNAAKNGYNMKYIDDLYRDITEADIPETSSRSGFDMSIEDWDSSENKREHMTIRSGGKGPMRLDKIIQMMQTMEGDGHPISPVKLGFVNDTRNMVSVSYDSSISDENEKTDIRVAGKNIGVMAAIASSIRSLTK